MEVLFITHKYPPSIGGMEKQSYELINGMIDKIKVHTLIHDQGTQTKMSFFFTLKKRVKLILSEYPNIDLIHLNDGLMAAFTTWLPKITDIPVVITYHGLDVVFPLRYYQAKVLPRIAKNHYAIAVSKATRKALIERGFPVDKVVHINNGVDHSIQKNDNPFPIINHLSKKIGQPLQEKKIIVSLGRAVPRKGFSWFMEKVLTALAADTVFILIGPKPTSSTTKNVLRSLLPRKLLNRIDLFLGYPSDLNKIQKIANDPLLENKFFHLSDLKFDEILKVLSAADLFVMPNVKVKGDMEGFGLVALEAALAETFVLASKMEGITDAIHHQKNGRLIIPEDQEEWIYHIYNLLHDRNSLKLLGEKFAIYTRENFSWEKMVNEYHHFFQIILNKPTLQN